MKTLQKLVTLALFLVYITAFSQTKETSTNLKKANVVKKHQTKIDTKKLKKFVGKYDLSEGNITLEIVQEQEKMYIISPWSKDPLKVKDENTLIEPTRDVYLSIIKEDTKALKYFQNGFETTIKRITSK